MSDHGQQDDRPRVATGVGGLDALLRGGLPSRRLYLISGGPGAGKTTLGFQFLRQGAQQGEAVLYVSLLQTREELQDVVRSHGWDLEGIRTLELPSEAADAMVADQTVFAAAEVELDEVTDAIVDAIREHAPSRMVLDSLSELRILVDGPLQMRRQLVKLKRAMLAVDCTTLVTAGESVVDQHPTYQTIVHGAIELSIDTPDFGAPRRQLQIRKVRGIDFDGGRHDMAIRTGGIEVYPRLLGEGDRASGANVVASGNESLDALFGGGLNCGSTCLIMGTTGAGESTFASLYAAAGAGRGEYAVVYCFDESRETYIRRSRGLGLDVADHVEQERIDLRHYDVGQLTPGRLMSDLRRDVETLGAKLVVFDSLSGLFGMMPRTSDLTIKLHEILHYLATRGVLVLVPVNLHGLLGEIETDLHTSYLADTVVLLRHFEAAGSVRQCISVLKKRHGKHERSIREVAFGPGGLRVGPPLAQFTGVLTGTPSFDGERAELLQRGGDEGGSDDD